MPGFLVEFQVFKHFPEVHRRVFKENKRAYNGIDEFNSFIIILMIDEFKFSIIIVIIDQFKFL